MPIYQNQKVIKPNPEDVAREFLDGDSLKKLLEFLGFLKDNKLKLEWKSSNSWSVRYKYKSICYVNLDENEKSWMVDIAN